MILTVAVAGFAAWAVRDVTMALRVTIAILVVTCPCALGLATPISIMVSVGKAAESGILVRNGDALQGARQVDTVVLDKTGTITRGAPSLVAVKAFDEDGHGSYMDVIRGIDWVVQNKDAYGIRVLNLSLSAPPRSHYWDDPLNQAVMEAWRAGIVVVASAGNTGPDPMTIGVPGNVPYVITVGALDGKRTPGYWGDDVLPEWSATGPTLDGFAKPDVLAPGMNIVSFMYNDHEDEANSARLVQDHPDYSETSSLFRMNGTSMATAMTSGVVALMLQADPALTPKQVKFRLMYSTRPAFTDVDLDLETGIEKAI